MRTKVDDDDEDCDVHWLADTVTDGDTLTVHNNDISNRQSRHENPKFRRPT